MARRCRLGFSGPVRYQSAMTDIERSIYQTLLDLDRAVQSLPTARPKPSLLPLFQRLDDLALQLPKGCDPDLMHYLHRKSYEKARLLLEGRNEENERGSCAR